MKERKLADVIRPTNSVAKMGARTVVLPILTVLSTVMVLGYGWTEAPLDIGQALPQPTLSVEELITGLQAEYLEGLGYSSVSWTRGFIPLASDESVDILILGVARPHRS